MPCLFYRTVKQVGMSRKEIEASAVRILTREKRPGASVSVHCVGESRMRAMNRQTRGIDRPTDVLSFNPAEAPVAWPRFPGAADDLGDLFLCVPYIRRQARRFGVPYREEFLRMLVHGVLHLLGYDHTTKKDAQRMFAVQEATVQERL